MTMSISTCSEYTTSQLKLTVYTHFLYERLRIYQKIKNTSGGLVCFYTWISGTRAHHLCIALTHGVASFIDYSGRAVMHRLLLEWSAYITCFTAVPRLKMKTCEHMLFLLYMKYQHVFSSTMKTVDCVSVRANEGTWIEHNGHLLSLKLTVAPFK